MLCYCVMNTDGLGGYIQRRRDELGLNQTELAKRADIKRAHFSQIEGGHISLPSAEIRRRLADALKVRHVDLLVAAKELTSAEVPVEGAEREPFPRDPLKADAVRIIADLDDFNTQLACRFLKYLRDEGQPKNADSAANNDSSMESAVPASAASQVSPIVAGKDSTRRPSS